jgi:hypothetical protein
VIDYEIFGSEMQYAEVTLDPGEMVIAEAGAMMYMTAGIKMETVFGDPSQKNQGFFDKVLSAGLYRLAFDTASYFAAGRIDGLYPQVEIMFQVRDGESHFHLPLLLSPNGYTTYRGS